MSFPRAAHVTLQDSQLRRNLAKATGTIREKREGVVGELPDWQELRAAGEGAKDAALADLPALLESWRSACERPAGRCTGRATPPRPTGSSAGSRGPPRWTRW